MEAVILQHKMNEFNQSKHSFIDGLPKFMGYSGFTEKQGQQFYMRIVWKDRNSRKKFMESDLYRYFRGALITLSKSNRIKIVLEESNTPTN